MGVKWGSKVNVAPIFTKFAGKEPLCKLLKNLSIFCLWVPHLTSSGGQTGDSKSKNCKSNERSFNNLQKRSFPPNLVKIRAQIRFDPHDPILTPFDPPFDPLRGHFSKIRLRILSCWAKIFIWCEFHKDSSMGTQKLWFGAALEIQKVLPFSLCPQKFDLLHWNDFKKWH